MIKNTRVQVSASDYCGVCAIIIDRKLPETVSRITSAPFLYEGRITPASTELNTKPYRKCHYILSACQAPDIELWTCQTLLDLTGEFCLLSEVRKPSQREAKQCSDVTLLMNYNPCSPGLISSNQASLLYLDTIYLSVIYMSSFRKDT